MNQNATQKTIKYTIRITPECFSVEKQTEKHLLIYLIKHTELWNYVYNMSICRLYRNFRLKHMIEFIPLSYGRRTMYYIKLIMATQFSSSDIKTK